MSAQVLDDGMVCCPACNHVFRATHGDHGSTYTRTWTKIGAKHMEVLSLWLSMIHPVPTVKLDAYRRLQPYLSMHQPSFGNRVSELKGLGLMKAARLPGQKPQYELTAKAIQVLNNGGALN